MRSSRRTSGFVAQGHGDRLGPCRGDLHLESFELELVANGHLNRGLVVDDQHSGGGVAHTVASVGDAEIGEEHGEAASLRGAGRDRDSAAVCFDRRPHERKAEPLVPCTFALSPRRPR